MAKLTKDSFYEREEKRLRAEIARKEHQLASLRQSGHKSPEWRATEAAAAPRRYGKRNYFSYLWTLIKDTTAYGIWERFLSLFRRFRLISLIIRVTGVIFVVVQTGTLFIIFSALTIITIPALLIGGIFTAIKSALLLHRASSSLKKENTDRAAFIFLPQNTKKKHCVADATASALSDMGYTVLIICPPFSSPRGKEDGIYYIGRNIYFVLNKRFFKNTKDRINIYL